MTTQKDSAIFVVGMHRSGTSAVSGALRYLDFGHGSALMEAKDDNPDGFWEQQPIVTLNNRILASLGARWDQLPAWLSWPPARPVGDMSPWLDLFAEEASQAWDEAFAGLKGGVVCKDPRLCVTLPLWLKVAKEKGYETRCLFVYRDALEISDSLTARNGCTYSEALLLTLHYWLSALSVMPAQSKIVRYDHFSKSPRQSLEQAGLRASKKEAAKLEAFIRPPSKPDLPKAGFTNTLTPNPLKALAEIFEKRQDLDLTKEEQAVVHRVRRLHEDACLLNGRSYALQTLPLPRLGGKTRKRKAVLHCHVFKNAGSSVDAILKKHFKLRWNETEYKTNPVLSNADTVNSFMRMNTAFDCFSTHTGDWWLDYSDSDLEVFPIIFLRHPLLRIRSAYSFERKQPGETVGAKLAKAHDFAGYIKARLDMPNDFAFRNFQAIRLAHFQDRVIGNLRSTALRALDRAPYIGLVDQFDRSAERLEDYLKPHFKDFQAFTARVNVTDTSELTLEEKLDKIRKEMGDEAYGQLLDANLIDLDIYEQAAARFK